MGSMGGMMFKYTGPEKFTKSNSAVDDKINDHAQSVVADDGKKGLNEECSDKGARVKNLKAASIFSCIVPTRPRTPRFEILTGDSEGVVNNRSADQVIVDETDSGKSKKRSRGEDNIVCNDGSEEPSLKKQQQQDCIVSEEGSFKMKQQDCIVSDAKYVEGENSKKKQQDSVVSDKDYEGESSEEERDNVAYDEDYGVESSKKQKKVEKKGKAVPVNNLPTELPQNLQEYISGLNLEVPPLFVAKKLLTATDVDPHQSRLLLPKSLINAEFFDNFLTEVEKNMLESVAVEVNVVDGKLREFNDLRLAKWKMTSSLEYVLRKGWNTVVGENNLEPVKASKDSKDRIVVVNDDGIWKTDVVVLVWCFRRDSKIWLALHTQEKVELNILGVEEDNNGKRYINGYL